MNCVTIGGDEGLRLTSYLDLALHEYAGLLRYPVQEMLGWNIKAERAGAV